MKSFLVIILILIESHPLWSQEKKVSRAPTSYTIQAPDGQNFSLHEFNLGVFTQYTVNFAFGQREQERRFAGKKQWEKWRSKWVYFMQNFPESKCAHPLKLVARENESIKKSKTVCLEKLTPSEREDIKKLVSAFDEFIYGQ